VRTLQAFESGKKIPHPNSIAAIRRAIEAEGIKLLFDEDGAAAGSSVRTPGSTYRAERPTTKEYRIPMRKPPRPRLKPAQAQLPIGPSSTLLRFANKIASSDGGLVLDVACGYGRNAIAVAARGCRVVCVDRDLSRLNILERLKTEYIKFDARAEYKFGKILPVCANISLHDWSFAKSIFNAVICVHFVEVSIFPCFMSSLRSGGYFYFETFGGQGGNFEALPETGEIRDALRGCNLEYYSEKRVGPRERDAVSVKVLARKY
jgi:SAM-dependent methyltransferase